MSQSHPAASDATHLDEIILAYLEAHEAGWAPPPERFLAAYPKFRAELAEFFAGRAELDRITAPWPHGPPKSGTSAWLKAEPSTSSGTPTSKPEPGREFLGELGDYRLIREVGRGGMGIVYEAEQISLRRRVALKVLPFAAALDPRQLQRFQNEATAAAHLRHEHIVPVHAVGSARGVHYYAMQFIDGQSLAALIAELRRSKEGKSPAPTSETNPEPTAQRTVALLTKDRPRAREHDWVAVLGRQAASAMAHAHEMGVVHRDIKPANLLLDPRGTLWVADFGLAQVGGNPGLTVTGEMLGTLRYASPEQALVRPGLVDHRCDIYALGATLYELLTLRPLFDGEDRHALLRQIDIQDPIPIRHWNPTVPFELETIILKAVAKEPTERYASAREFADDLQRYLDDQPIKARPPSLFERVMKWARRHRAIVLTAAAATVFLLAGLAVATVVTAQAYERERLKAAEADRERSRAERSFRQAWQAVDQFAAIGEEELAGIPQLEAVRRRLLQTALAYYEGFLAQHPDDPSIQKELVAGRARVTTLVAELTTLMGAGRFNNLQRADVQADLHLTDDQREQLAQLMDRWRESFRTLFRGPAAPTERQRLALAREQEEAVEQLLTPPQLVRFGQISRQLRGPLAFADADTADALKLTPEQKQKIRAILDTLQPPWIVPLFPPPEGRGRFGPPGKGDGPKGGGPQAKFWTGLMTELDPTFMSRLLAVLTPDQRVAWQRLIGPEFRPVPTRPPRGEPGPHPLP